jgi:pimeloyl-ACP methyl ester carboxylesterase
VSLVIVLVVITAFLVTLLVMGFETGTIQRWIIFNPRRVDAHAPRGRDSRLARCADVRIDGRLHGWLKEPGPGGDDGDEEYRALPADVAILYLHGRSNSVAKNARFIGFLSRLGAPLLALDFSGYGMSLGTPSEAQTYTDGEMGFDWLAARGYRRIFIYGYSLGGAVAAHVASVRPVAGAMIASTFERLADALPAVTSFMWRGWYPTGARLANEVTCPLLMSHSRADALIPYASARHAFDNARSEVKTFVDTRGSHARADLDSQYLADLRAFVQGVVGTSPSARSQGRWRGG